jgi:hypothetical protein
MEERSPNRSIVSAMRAIFVASRPVPTISMTRPSYMTLPPVPDSFEWIHESWGAALRCKPLDQIAPHLFASRQLELTAGHLRQLAANFGASDVVLLTQVHGNDVAVVRNESSCDGRAAESGRSRLRRSERSGRGSCGGLRASSGGRREHGCGCRDSCRMARNGCTRRARGARRHAA